MSSEYPPWGDSWRAAFPAANPFGGNRYLRNLFPPLLAARVVMLRIGLYMTLLFAISVAIPGDGRVLAWILAGAAAIWSVGCVGVLRKWVPDVLVRGREPSEAVIGIVSILAGFASVPAWVGFVGVLFGGGAAPYIFAMLVSVGLLTLSAPSRALVDRIERAAHRTGEDRDFHAAMLSGG